MTELRKFYVTFGLMYSHETHPYWPGADGDGWLTVLAPDEEAARHRVRMFIGLKWAFIYDEVSFARSVKAHLPKGELAVISTDGDDHRGVGAPTRQFGTSSPEYYGHDSNEVVAVRIEGILKHGSDRDAIEALGYEAEHFHPKCYTDGTMMFESISGVDTRVLAEELDWSQPYECPVCGVSIT